MLKMKVFLIALICLVILSSFMVETAATTKKTSATTKKTTIKSTTRTTTKPPITLQAIMTKLEALEAKLDKISSCSCQSSISTTTVPTPPLTTTTEKTCMNQTLTSEYGSLIQSLNVTKYGSPLKDSLVLKNGNILAHFYGFMPYLIISCNLTNSSCSQLGTTRRIYYCGDCQSPIQSLPDGNFIETSGSIDPILSEMYLFNYTTGEIISNVFARSFSYIVLENGNLFIQSYDNCTHFYIINPYDNKTIIASKYISNHIDIFAKMSALPNNQIALVTNSSSSASVILILNGDDLSEIKSIKLNQTDKFRLIQSLKSGLLVGSTELLENNSYYIWNISSGNLVFKIPVGKIYEFEIPGHLMKIVVLDNGFFAVAPYYVGFYRLPDISIYNPYNGMLVKQIPIDDKLSINGVISSFFSLENGNLGATINVNVYGSIKTSYINIWNTQIKC